MKVQEIINSKKTIKQYYNQIIKQSNFTKQQIPTK